MPAGAVVLHVGIQHRILTLWALVDPDAAPSIRRFAVVGTGRPAPEDHEGRHVGTVIEGLFVWHVFEESP